MSRHWVLVRGIVSEEFHWWNFVPTLKESFPGDIFSTPDIIGNGKFWNQRTPLNLFRNIDSLRVQVESSEKKKVLVGFSLGGMLALEWAHRHPDEVSALILVNSSLGVSKFYRRLRPSAMMRIARTAFIRNPLAKEAFSLGLTTNLPLEAIEPIAEVWSKRSQEFPVMPANFFRQAFVARQLKAQSAPPDIPVLVLSSRNDKVVHFTCSEKIAEKFKAPHFVHPTAGHDLFLESPEWIRDHVADFMKTNGL